MSRSRTLLLGPVALLILLTAACTPQEPEVTTQDQVAAADRTEEATSEGEAGGGGEAPSGEVIEWAAGNALEYTVAPDTVPADTELTFELTLEGLPHNVVIEGVEGEAPIVEGEAAGTYTGDVTLPAGEYTYYCSVAGHRAGGMEGTLTATG